MGIAKALRGKLERGSPPPALPGAGVLDSGSRVAVYRAVVESPGICIRDISRRVGKGETSVRWHLRRLTRAGLVSAQRRADGLAAGGALTLVPKGVYSEDSLELLVLINGPKGPILSAVSASPGISAGEIGRKIGASQEPLAETLAGLCAGGRLRRVRDGRMSRYFLSEDLASAMKGMRGEARRARDRLAGILQSEVPGLLSVSGTGGRVVAECPWGVEVFTIPIE